MVRRPNILTSSKKKSLPLPSSRGGRKKPNSNNFGKQKKPLIRAAFLNAPNPTLPSGRMELANIDNLGIINDKGSDAISP